MSAESLLSCWTCPAGERPVGLAYHVAVTVMPPYLTDEIDLGMVALVASPECFPTPQRHEGGIRLAWVFDQEGWGHEIPAVVGHAHVLARHWLAKAGLADWLVYELTANLGLWPNGAAPGSRDPRADGTP